MTAAREALRDELESRGHTVASDTLGARGGLYVQAEGDLAAALFEFHPSPWQAFEKMYQGSWIEGLPTRFVVMPADAAADPEFELLEQARIVPLLYEEAGDTVRFCDLTVLDEHLPR